MSRIASCFQALKAEGRTALIPYIVTGDPDIGVTVPLMHRMVRCGADIIELGVPFSDPMSEGPVIQTAHERALENGTSLRDAIAVVQEFRQENDTTPVLLMGYANPVERMGYAAFADTAAAAGVDALLTVDIPPEEVEAVNAELKRVGMDNIFLVAPTTPEERVARITEAASGFVYYVSVKGVTGSGNLDVEDVAKHVALIRDHTQLPVSVGFGIKDAASAGAVAGVADGVVVGSALVAAMYNAMQTDGNKEAAMHAVETLLSDIRKGIDSPTS
ncbi:MAG: tryptophan synthase subunit alpha [Pseudomonadota bacterium]